MDTPTLIDLDLIDPNPYQPRQAEDPAVVAEIADSIARNGLMQAPTARQVDGRYQLAFGHTRLAAFKMLQEPCMPLIVRDLDDLQMFELGVSENIKRRDLNPIEKAQAMRRYMDEFQKTSVEAGQFFNVSPEKVRSTIRLLNLPKPLQAGVADGTITQTNARRLLTIERVAPDRVADVATELKKDATGDPDQIISRALIGSNATVVMWQSWRRGESLAGEHLWPLRLPAEKFPRQHLPALKAGTLSQIALNVNHKEDLQKWIDWLTMGFIHGPFAPSDQQRDESVSDYLIRTGVPAELVERIAHLVNPPACSACPFYAKVNGDHYCTFKTCYDRKKKAWIANELEQAVKTLGIAEYDHKTDSKFVVLVSYNETHKTLVKAKHADLRLKKGTTYSGFEGVPEGFVIVAVGKTAEKLLEAEKEKNGRGSVTTNDPDYYAEQRRLREMREAHQEAMYDFLWNVGTPVFAGLLEPVINLPFLKEFADRMVRGVPAEEPNGKTPKKDRLAFYRRSLLFSLLDDALDMWDLAQKKKPVTAMAKDLQGLATTWGVKLPSNWLEQAAQADKAIVLPAEK